MPAFPMLRRKAEFEAIARRGVARTGRLLVMRTLRTDDPQARIGIATPVVTLVPGGTESP